MGPLADFNIVTIMYAIQLCLLATFLCVFLAYRDTVGLDSKSLFFAAPLPYSCSVSASIGTCSTLGPYT